MNNQNQMQSTTADNSIVFFSEFSNKTPVKKTCHTIITDFVKSSNYQAHIATGSTFDESITKFVKKYGIHDDITEPQMDKLYEKFEEKK